MIGNRVPPVPRRKESGITGLETAMLLVAFVVITAVFAYTILSAGLFAAGESKATVYEGLQTTQQTLKLKGPVTAYKNSVDTDFDRIGDTEGVVSLTFNLSNAMSGAIADLTPSYIMYEPPIKARIQQNVVTGNKVIINWNSEDVSISDCAWTVDFIGGNDGDYMLEDNETATLTIWLVNLGYRPPVGDYYQLGYGADDPFLDDASHLLQPNESLSLEIIPDNGATLTIERTLPPYLDAYMNLN
jgi:flagellin FlaB